jgi:polar amino acid transport system substrate-binding protein
MPAAGNMPAGSFMRTIQDRGQLIAGVRQDVPLIGFLNPRTNQIEGFDIEFVKAVTRAIFGDESKVDLRPVTAAARIPSVQEGNVDMVAAAMTITADRKTQIDFSTVYYEAGQRVLVKGDAPYTSIQDLGGKRICAAKGTTAEANIPRAQPTAEVVQADTYNECLLSLQQGRIDAISTDDVILAGLAAADPTTKLIGPKFSSEPYGIGVGKNHPEFVGFINGVIDQMKSDGRWTTAYDTWFGRFAGTAPEPPRSTYSS